MISYQAHILEKLIEGGARESAHALAKRLNMLATLGETLRQRYEDECSHQWANTPEFETRTRWLEKQIRDIAKAGGLHCYLQGDCRGATVYVDMKPIPDNNYSRAHCLTIESYAERKRRLAAEKVKRQLPDEAEGHGTAEFIPSPMGGGWIVPLNSEALQSCVEVFGEEPESLPPLAGRAGYVVEPRDVGDMVETLRNAGCGVNL